MSTQLTRQLPNWVTFPRQLRDAIPDWDLCAGRVLELESADARPTNTGWTGRRVAVKLQVCETGKLEGVFDVWIDLNISAAKALAEVLQTAAEQALTIPETDLNVFKVKR
jgi:hypothetical protein